MMTSVPTLQDRLYQSPWPSEFRFFQLACVVDDLHLAARRWADVFGIGPFHLMKRNIAPVIYRGEASTLDFQVAVAQAGPVQIELIAQYCDSPSVYREVFAKGEGGVHHLATVVRDFDAAKARYVRSGFSVISEFVGTAMRVGYIDTRAAFGFVTEVIEEQPAFMTALTRISDVCAGWDGTDPLRILTRDGYRVPDADAPR